jgi:F-type H+-transporting ATPase subunit a
MLHEGLFPPVLFKVGPIEVTATVVYSLIVSGVLIGLAWIVRRSLGAMPSRRQLVAEALIEHLEGIMRELFGRDPRPYTAFVVTLALFIGLSNLIGLAPGMKAPTADFSTDAAMAVVVFLAVPYFGIRTNGLRGYLKHYLEPTPILIPLEILTELTRTFALAVRLFGNILSEELVLAVLLAVAGVLVPVPIMMLAVLTGLVQAYIFSVLTMLYLAAAVRTHKR